MNVADVESSATRSLLSTPGTAHVRNDADYVLTLQHAGLAGIAHMSPAQASTVV